MKILFRLACLCSLLLAASCSQKLFSDVTPGQVLFVDKALVIPPGSARVLLQAGEIIHAAEIKFYQPRCWFIAKQIRQTAQPINTGRFDITSVRESYDTVYRPDKTYLLATINLASGIFSSMGSDDGPSAVEYATEMKIRSASQPGIIQLICSHWDDPDNAQHLTRKQIQTALGSYAHIAQR